MLCSKVHNGEYVGKLRLATPLVIRFWPPWTSATHSLEGKLMTCCCCSACPGGLRLTPCESPPGPLGSCLQMSWDEPSRMTLCASENKLNSVLPERQRILLGAWAVHSASDSVGSRGEKKNPLFFFSGFCLPEVGTLFGPALLLQ